MAITIREKIHYKFATPATCKCSSFSAAPERTEDGFSLVEVAIALIIILIALLGVFATFTYAISYNAGNNSRAQALAVLQREVELLRSAKFTPLITDNHTAPNDLTAITSDNDNGRDITGGTKATRIVTSTDGNRFRVLVVVDDDPEMPDVQINPAKTIKEIRVTVTLDSPTPGWQTSVPATVFLRRVRAN
jgi:prepilin-type N-terminal cleavage/methylation domain-containing protein